MRIGIGVGVVDFGSTGGVADAGDGGSLAALLLGNEADGVAINFIDQSMVIRDTATPANNYLSQGRVLNGALVGPGGKLAYASPSLKICRQSDGLFKFQPHNVCLQSNDVTSASWSKSNLTAPAVDTLQATAGTTIANSALQAVPVVTSTDITVEFEAKAGTNNFLQVFFSGAFGATHQNIDLSSGTLGTNSLSGVTCSITPAASGGGWYKLSFAGVAASVSLTYAVSIQPNATNARNLAWSPTGVETVRIRNLSVRRTNAGSDFVATTTAAVYGLPYECDTAGNYIGIRQEEARTNVCLWSNDLTNAAWSKTNATAALTATGPDGLSNSASTLTATSTNGSAFQAISAASAARSVSVFLKRRTGTGAVSISQGAATTGSELVSNGAFGSGIAGWTAYGTSTPTLSHTGSALLVTNTGTTAARGAYTTITCVVGKAYRVSATLTASSGTVSATLYAGSTAGGSSDLAALTGITAGNTGTITFRATATTVYISLNDQGTSATSTLTWDDVTVKELATTTVDLSSGQWVRGAIENETVTNPCVYVNIATSGDAVDVWCAQNEAGTFISSPILTFGSTVTRAIDNTGMLFSLFPNSFTNYSWYVDYTGLPNSSVTTARLVGAAGNTWAPVYITTSSGTAVNFTNAGSVTTSGVTTITNNTRTKISSSRENATSTNSITTNGAAPTTAAGQAQTNPSGTVFLGSSGTTNSANCWLGAVRFVPRTLSAAEHQAIST